MSINEPIQLDIIVVFAEWIDQNFSNFQPANVEAELVMEISREAYKSEIKKNKNFKLLTISET